uniref:DJ-1/PfpI domain-containing protein n=1 Tax=Arcella intermedia TaxID=1963864 RepID=A0A6B2LKF4_9EUKA
MVPIANGTEEIEAVCIIDTLRRGGVEVTVASVEPQKLVVCSRKTKIEADHLLADVHQENFDVVVLPGGMPGAERLRDSEPLKKLLHRQAAEKRHYAAICAAPAVVLEHHGLMQGHAGTAYPGHSAKLHDQSKVEDRVVVSENVITSRGPGTALEFSLKLIEVLVSRQKAEEVQKGMLVPSF